MNEEECNRPLRCEARSPMAPQRKRLASNWDRSENTERYGPLKRKRKRDSCVGDKYPPYDRCNLHDNKHD